MSQQHDFLSPVFEQCKQLKYFCYGCEKTQKALRESFRCCLCDSQSIEQVRQEDLSKFQIYEVDRQMTTSKTPLGFLENAVNECRRVPQSRIRVYETTQYITISLSSSSNVRSSLLQDMMAALFGDEDQDEGVTQDQIQKLTKIKDVHECSICQTSECEEDQESEGKQGKRRDGYKLKCNHTFHAECIEPWLKMKNTCPLCRLSISE